MNAPENDEAICEDVSDYQGSCSFFPFFFFIMLKQKTKKCGRVYNATLKAFHMSMCEAQHLGEKYAWDGTALSPQEERSEIEEATANDKMVANRPYFVLSYPWYGAWREYAEKGGSKPPQIDNAELLDSESEMETVRKGLLVNYDYIVVPGQVWQRFAAWYGGGPEIMRPAIRLGTSLVVDLYPVEVTAIHEGKHITIPLSASNGFRMVRHWLATATNMAPHKAELHVFEKKEDGTEEKRLLSKEDLKQTMEDAGISVSLKCELITVASELNRAAYSYSGSSSGRAYRPPESERGEPLARGVVGLYNLGNTCFLNSTLQSLSCVPAFSSFFTRRTNFENLLNGANPLGSKGKLVDASFDLLKEIWGASFNCVAPTNFKKILSSFAAQFSGYQQHDAQEALLVILNLLHEDLSVFEKGRPAHQLAVSPISDMFGGTYKSSVTCGECNTESIIYEPFLNVALPVPEKEFKRLQVTFFPLEGAPLHLSVRVNKSGNTNHIFHCVANNVLNLAGLEKRLVGVQLSGNSTYEMGPNKMVRAFREKDRALLFETHAADGGEGWRPHFVFSYVNNGGRGRGGGGKRHNNHHHHGGGLSMSGEGYGHHSTNQGPSSFGIPFVVSIKDTDSGGDALGRIREHIQNVVGVGGDLNSSNIQLVKFGGKFTGAPEQAVPLKSQLEAKACFGILWSEESAQIMDEGYKMIEKHPSCSSTEGDEEITTSLAECFNLAGAPDSLSVGDGWKCDTCKAARPGLKVMSIYKPPKVMVLHLKRFKMDFVSREKLFTLVKFPEELDIAPFVSVEHPPQSKYRLVSVCNHMGGLSGGHYTAFGKNGDDWFEFNDRAVSKSEFEKVVSRSAYMLFYVSEDAGVFDLPPVDELASPVPEEEGEEGSQQAKPEEKSTESKKQEPAHLEGDQQLKKPKKDEVEVQQSDTPELEPTEEDLSGSTYLCDICQRPVQGGWTGLSRHAKVEHNVSYD
jgi:ubiquitin C-terminal hydrolase